jgi:hypothetical protein
MATSSQDFLNVKFTLSPVVAAMSLTRCSAYLGPVTSVEVGPCFPDRHKIHMVCNSF